jgi:hypothetical protein
MVSDEYRERLQDALTMDPKNQSFSPGPFQSSIQTNLHPRLQGRIDSQAMLDRESCERRVFRLAVLLTGDSTAAVKVIAQVLDSQPDLRNLDGAHMDRLTVLRSREIKTLPMTDPGVPAAVAEALSQLPMQQREAWVFGRVYRLEPREMSRAMDCSTTALTMHLEQADAAMVRWLGRDAQQVGEQVLRYSLTLEVPRLYRQLRIRDERLRVIFNRVLVVASVLAFVMGAIWLVRALTGS